VYQIENRASILEEESHPLPAFHLGEINPSEGQAAEQMYEAVRNSCVRLSIEHMCQLAAVSLVHHLDSTRQIEPRRKAITRYLKPGF
jgi:radical SAM superfamily enzyme with C-terminal helix-hairpin-helix motif